MQLEMFRCSMYDWDITSLFPKETTVLQAGTTVVWHALGAALNMSMGAAAGGSQILWMAAKSGKPVDTLWLCQNSY